MNSIGPRTDPCGTPLNTLVQFELSLLITTFCFLLDQSAGKFHFRPKPVFLTKKMQFEGWGDLQINNNNGALSKQRQLVRKLPKLLASD